jgi:hypothetical protein
MAFGKKERSMTTTPSLGQVAYEAYRCDCGCWRDLDDEERQRWEAAAQAVPGVLCAAEGRRMMSHGLFLIHLRNTVDEIGSQKLAAQQWGISSAYLSDVLLGKRAPGDSILKPMGFHKVTLYAKVEDSSYASCP